MPMLKMSDCDLKGKRVLIREDFNVPLKNGKITSDLRIRASLPTIKQALKAGAKVMLMSHLGRPEEVGFDPAFSLAPVAQALSSLLKMEVPLISHWVDGVKMDNANLVLLENVRFNHGETDNNIELSKKMASLCDVFVMDAFATSHRTESSTYGIIKYVKHACAGPLLLAELAALSNIMDKPTRPVVAIVGGSKVSTKLALLNSLVKKVDHIIIGGGIANTFLAAEGYTVGKSLYEPDLIDEAERLTLEAKQRGAEISSRLIPPKVGAMALMVAIISSISCVARTIGKASILAKRLKSTALPSMTGSAASGPMLPRPSTAEPSEIIATPFLIAVRS